MKSLIKKSNPWDVFHLVNANRVREESSESSFQNWKIWKFLNRNEGQRERRSWNSDGWDKDKVWTLTGC